VRSVMFSGNHLDRFITAAATKKMWIEAAEQITKSLSDSLIGFAVGQLPKEIQAIHGNEWVRKLKSRRDELSGYANRYYNDLAKEVDVVGSFDDEYFQVMRQESGIVEVRVFNNKDGKPGKKLLYSRNFYPDETKEIRLFGLNGDDIFDINGEAQNSILVRVIPGSGLDKITDQSDVKQGVRKTRLYVNDKSSVVMNTGPESKLMRIINLNAYRYDRTAFSFNSYFPTAYLLYNNDDGLKLDFGVSFTKQGYDKSQFSSKHSIGGSFSTVGNFGFKYNGKWRSVLGNWDLQARTLIGNPINFNYFFGSGNETEKNNTLRFYSTRYNTFKSTVGLAKELWDQSRSVLEFNAGFERNGDQLRENNIFSDANIVGSNNQNIVIAQSRLVFDFRDNPNLPYKGMKLHLSYKNAFPVSDLEVYGVGKADIEQYMSTGGAKPLTLGLRTGGSLTYGDVPFYDLSFLGQGKGLRGFRRNRFAGEKSWYFNSDLRWQMLDVRTIFLPLKFGISGFFDAGRVFVKGENSDKIHKGYGGGFYIVPLKEQFIISFSISYSEEERNFVIFSIGKSI